MALETEILHVPTPQAGFNYSRNFELIPDTGLIDPSTNFNLHNLGIEKRGGTSIVTAETVNQKVLGGYDFRLSTGAQHMVFAKANGNVYDTDDSTSIANGMSLSNFYHFSQFYDTMFIADGASTPKQWTGAGAATNVTPATDFATDPPFQIIFHPRGASFRNWAINREAVYASKDGTGDDFADADVKKIPVYSRGGLVGAIEFGQELFVFSKTECFRIDDSDIDPTNWGYKKAIWEGGAAHWRLIVRADNDVYIMTDDLTIYSLQGVFQTGDYRKASVSRPAQIDRYLRENSSSSNLEQWHAAYDPKLRCIKWFIQVGGTNNNTALVQFIDRDPTQMWAFHDNKTYMSGYQASASFTYRKTTSDWRIRTGDISGNIWELEQSNKNDNNNPIQWDIKWKPWEMENAVMTKRFHKFLLRIRSNTNVTLTVLITVDSIRLPSQTLNLTASGARYDFAHYDQDYYASDAVSHLPIDIKTYGKLLQLELINNGLNEDVFLAEVLVAFKENGVRIYA